MKKIYLDAVLEKNLGDDLFIKIISNRYNAKFYTQTKHSYKNVRIANNLKIYSGLGVELINVFGSKILKKGKMLGRLLKNKCDFMVSIGGSIFIEWGKFSLIKRHFGIYDSTKVFYILGSNFGAYKTTEFFNFLKDNVISQAQDVCFREEYSYNLFKDLPNVRYASDIVFSLDTSNIKITDNKKVVMSVVDCNRKAKPEFKKDYENKIIDMIKLFDKKGYEVVLMSYCKAEGDEDAIKSILSQITDDELKNKVKTYFYDGNIEEALDVMADCQVVVGTRFHANILGFVLNKTVIPVAYSDKTLNVLKDMNFEGKVFDIRDLESFDVDSLTDDDLKYKLNVDFQREDAQRHFEKLDKVLERKGKDE